MLRAAAVLVFEGRDVHLVPAEATALHPRQCGGRRVAPLRHKDDEGQWFTGALQKILRGTRARVSVCRLVPTHSVSCEIDMRSLTSKCFTMVSMSSSQKGGFASNEPLAGEKLRNGLCGQNREV